MLSQTEESPLINVSSARPKTDEPFPCGAISSNEMKKKHWKLLLQWPPQSLHKKVIDRTLGLYQHGPPPKAGTADKWPPPTVKNPWDKTFVPKEFPRTHKIPSSMPKRWDLHSSSPLMLRPPQSTAVTEVPEELVLARSLRSQGCPYGYDVGYIHRSCIQLPAKCPPVLTWLGL